jgi:hypothetical protein
MSALLVAALLAAAPADAPGASPPSPARPAIRTLAGKITEVALGEGRVVLEAADGPVAVTVDRNTMVYLETRFGTVRDLAVGLPARISVGETGPAHWIEIRPKGLVPTPAATPTATSTPTPTATPTPTPTATSNPAPAQALDAPGTSTAPQP